MARIVASAIPHMTRTPFACAMLLAVSILATFASPARAQAGAPIPGDPVGIEGGKLSGVLLPSGVKAYLGVPYAAAPVRELRWREPQPVAAWQGVYHADRKGPECIQVLRRKNLNHYFGEEATSEDCLYMNIWAPGAAEAGARLPVVVFVYGGGFTLGSSGMAMYGGEHVARHNAVFVNFNYRVGAMGYLAHPELTAESPHRASGHYGFLDQIAALRWIRTNIDQLGGDPGNVTVSGQSAGAMAVSALAASPLAKGLLHRGFGMSFSFLDPRFAMMTAAEAERTGLEVQKALEAKSLAEMRTLPADKILAVQKDCQLGCAGTIRIGTSVDGYFLPDTVANIYAAGKQNDIPIVSGFTRDESSNEIRAARTLDEYAAAARKMYGDRAEGFLKLYPASTDAEAKAMGVVAARESLAEKSSRLWALAQTATGKAPFYMYMFSRVHPFAEGVTFFDNPKAIGAYHTSDVPYWFQTQEAFNLFRKTRDWTAFDRELSARMMDSLLAFARTGDPTTPATPWPRWSVTQPQYLEFGDVTRIGTENTERMTFHGSR
jgi:para-nitrobenzyl esterase